MSGPGQEREAGGRGPVVDTWSPIPEPFSVVGSSPDASACTSAPQTPQSPYAELRPLSLFDESEAPQQPTAPPADLSYTAPWLEPEPPPESTFDLDPAMDPHRLLAQGGIAARFAGAPVREPSRPRAVMDTPHHLPVAATDIEPLRRIQHSPEFRREYTEAVEDWDAFHNAGGSLAPPHVRDSSAQPKCLTPEGERLELERRYGRPFTDEEVRAYREVVGLRGSRAGFEKQRETKGIYPDGFERTREEWERELAGRTLGVLASGPLAALAWGVASAVTPDRETQMHAGGAMAALEQAAGSFAVAEGREPVKRGADPHIVEPRAVQKQGGQAQPFDPIGDRGLAHRGYRPKPGERATTREKYRAQRSAERDAAKFRPAKGGASSAANAERHKRELAKRQAISSSPYTRDGGLTKEAIRDAKRIIEGSELNNPEVIRRLTADGSRIQDWGKYETKTFETPSGSYKAHFYYNPKTGKVDLNIDYKSVHNKRGARG